MQDDLDPEGRRLPVKIDGTSNGEFLPEIPGKAQRAYNRHAREISDHYANRLNLSRRSFLKSSCGMAAGLLALNQIGKTFDPKTKRDFLALANARQGYPAWFLQ